MSGQRENFDGFMTDEQFKKLWDRALADAPGSSVRYLGKLIELATLYPDRIEDIIKERNTTLTVEPSKEKVTTRVTHLKFV